MCGIAGSVIWQEPDKEATVQKMVTALLHRGPDAHAVWKNAPAVLGHSRLSVIDTHEHANQPMHDETGRWTIVFNGEIYNFKELRNDLEAKGATFVTTSDTEVILQGWKVWGADVVTKLVGMFAFAIWDSQEGELYLVRDRMGEKPLYMMPAHPGDYSKGMIFASELKALALHPRLEKSVSQKALSQYLSLNYVLSDAAMYEGVEKLEPAHFMCFDRQGNVTKSRYWNLAESFRNKDSQMTEAAAIEQFNALLDETIKGQLISDVPLGAFLSGGIDSSTVTAAMARQKEPKDIHSFSIGFKERSYSEVEKSKQVAAALGINHHTHYVDADIVDVFPKIIHAMDEPFADSSMIPMYFLAEFARQKITVALSGDGCDELFLGYETYAADKLHRLMGAVLPKTVRGFLEMVARRFIPTSFNKVSLDYKIKQFLKQGGHDARRAHYGWRVVFDDVHKGALLHDPVSSDPYETFEGFYNEVKECDFLDQASYVDTKTWLVDDILTKVDRSTMAHSLEARAPFLDHRIVELAARMPVDLKMKGWKKKYIVKRSQEAYLDSNILYQKKRGFNSPVSHWFQKELYSYGYDVTTSKKLCDFMRKDAIERLWKEHKAGEIDHGLRLLNLVSLAVWLDNA